MSELRERCSVEGRILRPCGMLDKAIDDSYPTSKKGLLYFETVHRASLKPLRSVVIAKCGEFRGAVIALNFCPFCGADIISHWERGEDE